MEAEGMPIEPPPRRHHWRLWFWLAFLIVAIVLGFGLAEVGASPPGGCGGG